MVHQKVTAFWCTFSHQKYESFIYLMYSEILKMNNMFWCHSCECGYKKKCSEGMLFYCIHGRVGGTSPPQSKSQQLWNFDESRCTMKVSDAPIFIKKLTKTLLYPNFWSPFWAPSFHSQWWSRGVGKLGEKKTKVLGEGSKERRKATHNGMQATQQRIEQREGWAKWRWKLKVDNKIGKIRDWLTCCC